MRSANFVCFVCRNVLHYDPLTRWGPGGSRGATVQSISGVMFSLWSSFPAGGPPATVLQRDGICGDFCTSQINSGNFLNSDSRRGNGVICVSRLITRMRSNHKHVCSGMAAVNNGEHLQEFVFSFLSAHAPLQIILQRRT